MDPDTEDVPWYDKRDGSVAKLLTIRRRQHEVRSAIRRRPFLQASATRDIGSTLAELLRRSMALGMDEVSR